MTGLEKLVEWLDSKAGASVLVKDYWLEAADKARALLAEEQANKPVEDEPLEELAKRKGHRLELAGWLYRQDGSLVVQRAENMAALRAYLNGLDDKGDK